MASKWVPITPGKLTFKAEKPKVDAKEIAKARWAAMKKEIADMTYEEVMVQCPGLRVLDKEEGELVGKGVLYVLLAMTSFQL